jgi:hypothetical protein
MPHPTRALRRGRGRPRKFAEPSRAVTVTLPESALARLAGLDDDLSLAIVRLLDREQSVPPRPPAELATFGRRAVITVRPTPALERRVGLDVIPMPDGRALISFDQPNTIADLELTLNDALDERHLSRDEREVFEAIGAILKEARRSSDILLLRRSIIVLEYTGRARAADAGATSARPRRRE